VKIRKATIRYEKCGKDKSEQTVRFFQSRMSHQCSYIPDMIVKTEINKIIDRVFNGPEGSLNTLYKAVALESI